MPISKVKSGSITDSAVTSDKINNSAVTSAKIQDGSIVNADINACAAIASSKLTVDTSALETDINTNKFNISLLGFKMAVNEGLTVFNLVDGVVDEFNDETGIDEAEGSNDVYCATSDFYANYSYSPICISAGFTTTSITEPDTSTAGTNPAVTCGTYGQFTVPCGATSINIYAFGAGGGGGSGNGPAQPGHAGGGGFASGTLAVTAGQVLEVVVGEGGGSGGEPGYFLGGGGPARTSLSEPGGGLSGVFTNCEGFNVLRDCAAKAPQVYLVAGGGGGGGHTSRGGGGGGLTGNAGGENSNLEQTSATPTNQGTGDGGGGGGDQEQGGAPANPTSGGQAGAFLEGGASIAVTCNTGGGGGGGYWGGGSGTRNPGSGGTGGGGGSSYYGNPQITCGATEDASTVRESGGKLSPFYVADTGEGGPHSPVPAPLSPTTPNGEDGYLLIQASACVASPGGSSTIVSDTFTSSSVATSARIVVFEEDVDTPTLNTDVIASVSRDGTNFTNVTLSDSGYVTGSSGQRILTGQADISGQPSGQSMRWKLALANNTVKIHGVSLQWS